MWFTTKEVVSRKGKIMDDKVDRSLNALLDEYFDNVRQALGSKAPRTAGAEAAFVGLSPGHWSRLRNGKVALTPEVARSIADAVGQAVNREPSVVQQELSAARSIVAEKGNADLGIRAVHDLFQRISHERAMLFVNYGAWPMTMLHESLSSIGALTINAINQGMRLVMIEPLGSFEELQECCSREAVRDLRWDYYFHLARRVRELFQEIRSTVQSARKDNVILLEAAQVNPLAGPALGTQLYYAEYVVPSRPMSGVRETFQFLRSDDGKYHFIAPYEASLLQEAMQADFDPILKAYRRSFYAPDFTLPQDTESLHALGKSGRSWTIVQEP